jgi:hypothetical protein
MADDIETPFFDKVTDFLKDEGQDIFVVLVGVLTLMFGADSAAVDGAEEFYQQLPAVVAAIAAAWVSVKRLYQGVKRTGIF